jgi:hypothetical protein
MFAIGDYVYTGLGHGAGIYKTWYRYDPVDEEWMQVEDIPGEGRVAGTQFAYGGLGFVLSGDGDDHFSMEEGEFWSYDPIADSWAQLPSHPGKSRWAPASFVLDGIVYLYNGTSWFNGTGNVYQADAYKFDLDALISSVQKPGRVTNISFYPNPVRSILHIDSGSTHVDMASVYTVSNMLVYRERNAKSSLDLSFLPAGVYRIEVSTADGMYSELVVKE